MVRQSLAQCLFGGYLARKNSYMKLHPRDISLNPPTDPPIAFVALLLGYDVLSTGIRSGMAPAHHVQCGNSATAFRRPDYQQYHGI